MDAREAELIYEAGKETVVKALLEMDARITVLGRQVLELQSKIASLSSNSTNSSKPPSSDGHAGSTLDTATSRCGRLRATGRCTMTAGTLMELQANLKALSLSSMARHLEALATELHAPVEITWPYELFAPGELDALGDGTQHEVFNRCREHLHSADMLIALLDGPLVDDGTAWEIGYYYAVRPKGALIIGIRTDQRWPGEFANSLVNCTVECACDRMARSVD